jgi:hypothetical protein
MKTAKGIFDEIRKSHPGCHQLICFYNLRPVVALNVNHTATMQLTQAIAASDAVNDDTFGTEPEPTPTPTPTPRAKKPVSFLSIV